MVKDINFPSFKENVKTVFNYEFCCLNKEDGLVFPTIMMAWGLTLGLLFGFFVAEFIFLGNDSKKKYDDKKVKEGV